MSIAEMKLVERPIMRKVVYKVDYQPILTDTYEKLLEYIWNNYLEDFDVHSEKSIDTVGVGFTVTNGKILPDEEHTNVRRQNVMAYEIFKKKHCDGVVLTVGKEFILMELNIQSIAEYKPYYEWFGNIIGNLINITNGKCKLTRLGLFKSNSFFILDDDFALLDDFFAIDFFNKLDVDDIGIEAMNNMQMFSIGEYTLNFGRHLDTGYINGPMYETAQKARNVAFDYDIYTNSVEAIQGFIDNPKQTLVSMNSIIFECFNKTVSKNVLDNLTKEKLNNDYKLIILE